MSIFTATMQVDLSYEQFQSLVHNGLAGLPTERTAKACDIALGVIVEGPRVTLFSSAYGGRTLAAHSLMVDETTAVKGSGGVVIDANRFIKTVRLRGGGSYTIFSKSRTEFTLCPPLVKGFDAARMRMRMYTAMECSPSDSGGQLHLYCELYDPSPNAREYKLTSGYACAPLEEFSFLGSAECVLSVKASALKSHVERTGGMLKMRGSIVEFGMDSGYCNMIIRNGGLISTIDLLPGEYEAHRESMWVSFNAKEILKVAAGDLGADIQICQLTDSPNSDGRVRFICSGKHFECESVWGCEPSAEYRRKSAARNTIPVSLDRDKLLQSVELFRVAKIDKIRLRLHHQVSLVTIMPGSPRPKKQLTSMACSLPCHLPPLRMGLSSWCVNRANLLRVLRSMTGDKVRIYPADNEIILLDSDNPFVSHRLICLQPDDLGEEVEKKLLNMEADMVKQAERQFTGWHPAGG